VVVVSFAVLTLRLFIQSFGGYATYGGSIAGGAANAITILIMNMLWKFIATKLNDWENYRTESEYENNLIFKSFTFYFVNSYTSLYYIAFFKRNTHPFDSSILDFCRTTFDLNPNDNGTYPVVIGNGCADEVTFQLVTILAVNMFVGQATEVAIPWLMGKGKLWLTTRNGVVTVNELPAWEKENELGAYEGTLDEYAEMVVQFGYLTIFAATFPLAPLLAVLNNMVEIRTDAFKMLDACTRPPYKGAQNIGTWYYILEIIGVIAVFTNCALIGLTFEELYQTVGVDTPDSKFITLAIVVLLEHFIFIIKFIISFLVPDYPGRILKKMAFEDWLKQEAVKAAAKKGFVKQVWKPVDNKDDEIDDENLAHASVIEEPDTAEPEIKEIKVEVNA